MKNILKFLVLLFLMLISFIAVNALFSGRFFAVVRGAVTLGSIIAGMYLYKRSQRKGLRTTVEHVEKDERAPVIYLRSFRQEEADATLKARMRDAFGGDFIPGVSNPNREEEQHNLAKYFNQIGPYVALGRPGEAIPFSGPRKVYVTDDEWKDVVGSWIDRAAAIVLEPGGPGEGLSWEIGYIVTHVPPVKVLVILPRVRSDYKQVRDSIVTLLPRPIPERVPKGTRLLTFKPDWEPVPITSLHPFFKQNNFVQPKDVDPYF